MCRWMALWRDGWTGVGSVVDDDGLRNTGISSRVRSDLAPTNRGQEGRFARDLWQFRSISASCSTSITFQQCSNTSLFHPYHLDNSAAVDANLIGSRLSKGGFRCGDMATAVAVPHTVLVASVTQSSTSSFGGSRIRRPRFQVSAARTNSGPRGIQW
jgi:hypothetical protein